MYIQIYAESARSLNIHISADISSSPAESLRQAFIACPSDGVLGSSHKCNILIDGNVRQPLLDTFIAAEEGITDINVQCTEDGNAKTCNFHSYYQGQEPVVGCGNAAGYCKMQQDSVTFEWSCIDPDSVCADYR